MAVSIIPPVPSWSQDAKPSDIQTEVRKALSDLSQQISAQLNSLSSNPLGSFPTASSGSIFNSGSNANGSYIQFSDGTMIQYKSQVSISALSHYTWTFPIVFIDTTYVTPSFNANPPGGNFVIGPDSVTRSVSQVSFYTFLLGGSGSANYDLFAIGKWK